MELTGVGVWSSQLRFGDVGLAADAASELEALGYTALWFPDGGGDVLGRVEKLLAATERVVVATGILNLWRHEPDAVAARRGGWTNDHQDRFLLGIGFGHGSAIEPGTEDRNKRPVATTAAFLDALDVAATPVPQEGRVLAALGPKMLELARARAAGAHPYNVTPEHTARAREVLGPLALLAPEQAVLLDAEPTRARQTARESHVAFYLNLPNYVNNLRRLGFTDDDLADGGSDRLIDALVAWGDVDAIARRVREHVEAGADHVCLQVVTPDHAVLPRESWRELAAALIG